MIPVVDNKRVAYHQHVLLDVMIELWYMIISFLDVIKNQIKSYSVCLCDNWKI